MKQLLCHLLFFSSFYCYSQSDSASAQNKKKAPRALGLNVSYLVFPESNFIYNNGVNILAEFRITRSKRTHKLGILLFPEKFYITPRFGISAIYTYQHHPDPGAKRFDFFYGLSSGWSYYTQTDHYQFQGYNYFTGSPYYSDYKNTGSDNSIFVLAGFGCDIRLTKQLYISHSYALGTGVFICGSYHHEDLLNPANSYTERRNYFTQGPHNDFYLEQTIQVGLGYIFRK